MVFAIGFRMLFNAANRTGPSFPAGCLQCRASIGELKEMHPGFDLRAIPLYRHIGLQLCGYCYFP